MKKLLQVGLCECGCGRPTSISKKSDRAAGYVKGNPRRYIRGHQPHPPHVGFKRVPPERLTSDTKKCNTCLKDLPRAAFYRASNNPDGLMYLCILCSNKKSSAYLKTEAGKEARRRGSKKLRKTGYYDKVARQPHDRYVRARRRATAKGLSFSLTEAQYLIIIDHPCAYCGFKIPPMTGSGVDRADNRLGYSNSNSVSCCGECNRIKSSNFSEHEMRSIVGPAIREVKLSRVKNG